MFRNKKVDAVLLRKHSCMNYLDEKHGYEGKMATQYDKKQSMNHHERRMESI